LVVPQRGFSMLDVEGAAFWDPEADHALVEALKRELAGTPEVEVVEVDASINDEALVREMVGKLHRWLCQTTA
jgi:uncharacterized protein (UPF0261 family)